MRPNVLRLLIPILLSGVIAAPGTGAPGAATGSAVLRLTAERPVLEPAGGRYVVPRVAGFGLTSRAGEPMLPVRVLKVAIPEGSVPALQILETRDESLPPLRVIPRLQNLE